MKNDFCKYGKILFFQKRGEKFMMKVRLRTNFITLNSTVNIPTLLHLNENRIKRA